MPSIKPISLWPYLSICSAVAVFLGILVSRFLRLPLVQKLNYTFHPIIGGVGAIILAGVLSTVFYRWPIPVIVASLIFGYLSRWLPQRSKPFESSPGNQPQGTHTNSVDRVLFRQNWDARPRYETDNMEGEGIFVGREELVDRLTSDFIAKRSGTVLISGVRGVGKTALVERSLVEARNKLQDRYWVQTCSSLKATRFWQPIQARASRVVSKIAKAPGGYLEVKQAARECSRRAQAGFWRGLNPVARMIRRMDQASSSQLFVLKFNASDISGSLSDPSATSTGPDKDSGKPTVNPEKLFRALIRKLFMTCHHSRSTVEADILKWSLRSKKHRQYFFDVLQNAYNKSVSKSYKEVVSSSINEAIKQAKSVSWEQKVNDVIKVLGLLAPVVLGLVPVEASSTFGKLKSLIVSGAAVVAGCIALSWSTKKSRETTSDRARQAQFSYEFDYSLAQMEYDLQAIIQGLHSPAGDTFDHYRCYDRMVIIFDELDKLEDPVRQLNDVITHFKNFFTLSDAIFVFITDHEFYEHLSLECAKAQCKRQYSVEHTFFTQRIYLRKPEFLHFRETLYRLCDRTGLESRLRTAPFDADLTECVLNGSSHVFEGIEQIETLTYLYIHRERYEGIDLEFRNHPASSHPLALAKIWTSQVVAGIDEQEKKKAFDEFERVNGWGDPEAVAFLYYSRDCFDGSDKLLIDQNYDRLKPSLERYTSVDQSPVTLSDLARILCFQTKNHYFDLYHLIYDYVGSYEDGAPVLHVENERFTKEQKLLSRYQQMVEAAFYYRRDNHPSREYFNNLLMEVLYSVFDNTVIDMPVKVGDVLFSAAQKVSALNPTTAQPSQSGTANTTATASTLSGAAGMAVATAPVPALSVLQYPGTLISPRDEQQINQAVVRLLRMLLLHDAIDPDPHLAQKLKAAIVADQGWSSISEFSFSWKNDCKPIISQQGIDLEPYEQELIDFWESRKPELEALREELRKPHFCAKRTDDSIGVTMSLGIERLKSTAEGLRQRNTTISRADASVLKTTVGTSATLATQVPLLIGEALLSNSEVEVLSISDLKDGAGSAAFRAVLASHMLEIEAMVRAKLPVRTIIFPKESSCLLYLLAGPIPVNANLNSLGPLLPRQNVYLLWYVSGQNSLDLADRLQNLQFYFPPPSSASLSSLYKDCKRLATRVRVLEITVLAQQMSYKDRGLARSAGARLIGPLNALSEPIVNLSHPAVALALTSMGSLLKSFGTEPIDEICKSYGIGSGTPDWSEDLFSIKIAEQIVASVGPNPPGNLKDWIVKAISQVLGARQSKLSPQAFAAKLISDPQQLPHFFLQASINQAIDTEWQNTELTDETFKGHVMDEFGSWLLAAIETLARSKKVESIFVPEHVNGWAAELEQQRLNLSAYSSGDKPT